MNASSRIILAGTVAALVTVSSAQGFTERWLGTSDASWGNADNWNISYTPGAGIVASFDGLGGLVDVIDLEAGGSSIGDVVFDTASAVAYTIGGGAVGSQTLRLDITGDPDPAGTITVNAGVTQNQLFNANVVLNSVLKGSGGYTDAFTFDNNAAGTTLKFAGGITSGGNAGPVTLTVGGTSTTEISGNLTDGVGPVALTKTGGGTLIFSGTSSYSGATTISAGTLQVTGSLGAGSQVNVGAAGTLGGTGTVNGNVTVTGNGIINLTGGTLAGTVRFTGGRWDGTGSATGVVTVTSGTLTIGTAGNLSAPAGLNVTGGSFAAGGAASTLTSSLNYASSSTSTFSGVIAGPGATVTMNTPGLLTLSGANTYTGGTTINAGTLTISGSLVSGSPLTFDGGGTFTFGKSAGTNVQNMGLLTVIAGEATVQSKRVLGGHNSLVFSNTAARLTGTTMSLSITGVISGTAKIVLENVGGVITPTGALLSPGYFYLGVNYAAYDAGGFVRSLNYGTDVNAPAAIATGATLGVDDATKNVTISGAITGQTTAAVNTVRLAANGLTIAAANVLSVNGLLSSGVGGSFSGGTLQTTAPGGEMVIRADTSTTFLTMGSVIRDFNAGATASAVTKAGAGTLIFKGTNTHTGVTTVAAGTLQLGTGVVGEDGSVAGSIVNHGALIFHYATGANVIYAGNISGNGPLTKRGEGSLRLSGAGTYKGLTTVTNGVLRMGAAGVLPATGLVTLSNNLGASLDLNGFNQTIATITGGGLVGGGTALGSATLTVGDATSFSYSGPFSGIGGGLTKQGSGVMTLTGASTYTGPTSITGGTLRLGSGGSISPSTSLNLAGAGTTYDMNGIGSAVSALNGPAGSAVALGPATLTVSNAVAGQYDGSISGAGGVLTKSGNGTLTLGGELSYTGTTTVSAGTLQVNGSLSSGTFGNLNAGATLGIGASGSVARNVTVAGGTVNLAGTMPTGTTLTLASGTINSLGTTATAATVNLPVQGASPVLSAPANQELTVTTKLSQNNGRTVITAGSLPFKVGGANIVNNIDQLILAGTTTLLEQKDSLLAPIAPNLPTTHISVTASSTLEPNFSGAAILGALTINAGVLTVQTATSTSFASVTVLDNAEIAGAPITLRTGTVAVPAGKTFTISSNVVGTTAISKTGSGTLTLNGSQLYNSLTTSAGTTNINGALGSTFGSAVVVANADTRFGSVSQRLASLTIGAGAKVTFTSGTAGAFAGDGKPGGSAVVPEPGTLGLLLAGSLGLLASRRRRGAVA